MNIFKHSITDHLKPFIHSIWMIQDGESTVVSPEVEAFPHGFVYINVNAERKIAIEHGIIQQDLQTKAYLCGQTTMPSRLKIPNVHRSLVIRFHPWVIPALFGLSAAECADQYIPLELIDRTFNDQLEELVEGDFDFNTIAERTKGIIKAKLNCDSIDSRMVVICKSILAANGSLNIPTISSLVNVSERRVQQLFKNYIGITPKRFSRIVRFNRYLFQMLMDENSFTAHDLYFDQAHFIKEIKELTYKTPTKLKLHLNSFYTREAYIQNNLYHSG